MFKHIVYGILISQIMIQMNFRPIHNDAKLYFLLLSTIMHINMCTEKIVLQDKVHAKCGCFLMNRPKCYTILICWQLHLTLSLNIYCKKAQL